MIDELVKSVRLHLSERLTSPLMGAFLAAWGAWNYRFLMVVFSGESVETKFKLIDELYSTLLGAVGVGIGFPILTALGYIYIYPIPAKAVYIHSRNRQRDLLEARRASENETPLTKEDEVRIRTAMRAQLEDHSYEIEKRDNDIERLTSALKKAFEGQKQLENSLAAIAPKEQGGEVSPAPEPRVKLTKNQEVVLRLLANIGGTARSRELISESLSRLEVDFYLEELLVHRLVKRGAGTQSEFYSLTQKGRAWVLKR